MAITDGGPTMTMPVAPTGMMGGGYYMGGDGSAAISIIPPWLMLAALVFATLVGLVAGILPANKAVKISALEAIRHD